MKTLTADQCATRYPRLVRAMRWAACLSAGEAACTLRDIAHVRAGILPADYLRWGGGEAVSHFGGPRAVLEAAIRCRHITRTRTR